MKASPLSIAAFGIVLVASAPGASALTIVQSNGTNPDGSPKLMDPDQKAQNLTGQSSGNGGMTTLHMGGTTLQFGVSPSFGNNFGGESRFLDNPASRTVPSEGFGMMPYRRW